jgi:hypothetical protein
MVKSSLSQSELTDSVIIRHWNTSPFGSSGLNIFDCAEAAEKMNIKERSAINTGANFFMTLDFEVNDDVSGSSYRSNGKVAFSKHYSKDCIKFRKVV